MFFIFFIFSVFLIFSLLSKKYSNPNTLTFLFGKKGSGKSTYMVKLMIRDLRRGWTVYTNMQDVNIPSVRIFDAQHLKNCRPDEHSAVYIDEVGLIWDNRGFKDFDRGYTEFFKLQRKYKCKLVINSQAWDVDKKIRDLTDSMALQTNLGNIIGITRPIKRSITLTEPSAEKDSRIADRLKFASILDWKITWLPRYFRYFDSYAAPHRELVPYRVVPGEFKQLGIRSVPKAIRKSHSFKH